MTPPPASRQPLAENTLFYGDNLEILREYVPGGGVCSRMVTGFPLDST